MLTWVRNDRVYGAIPASLIPASDTSSPILEAPVPASDTSSPHDAFAPACLFQLPSSGIGSEPSSGIEKMRWSPTGDRVLLGSSLVGSSTGISQSGFSKTADVNWSLPSGDSLVGIDQGKLVKKFFGGEPFDVSFLATHLAAAYHPAGNRVVSSGIDLDETNKQSLGIWIADDNGKNKKLIVSHGDAIAVGEPMFNPTGEVIYFTAEHAGLFQVHRYTTATSSLDTLLEGGTSIDSLVVDQSTSDVDSLAVRVGSCRASTPTDVKIIDPQANDDSPRGTSIRDNVAALREKWLTPIGWLPNHVLAVMARGEGCEGAGAIWLIRTPTDNAGADNAGADNAGPDTAGRKIVSAELVVDHVTGPSVRVHQSEVFNPGLFIGGPPVS